MVAMMDVPPLKERSRNRHGSVLAVETKLEVSRNKQKTMLSATKLKLEFLRLLTEDSLHHDMRKKDFNQAIFDAENGYAIFNGTDLEMVMEKFNQAVKNVLRTP